MCARIRIIILFLLRAPTPIGNTHIFVQSERPPARRARNATVFIKIPEALESRKIGCESVFLRSNRLIFSYGCAQVRVINLFELYKASLESYWGVIIWYAANWFCSINLHQKINYILRMSINDNNSFYWNFKFQFSVFSFHRKSAASKLIKCLWFWCKVWP